MPIHTNMLTTAQFETPLGPMIAVADETALYLLEFADHPKLHRVIDRLFLAAHATIIEGHTPPLGMIKHELIHYFKGTLKEFKTPLHYIGSDFQKHVWDELKKIPFGKTCSYAHIATTIEKPSAFRAVARANSTNKLALIIPCHRVIKMNGNRGGYSGGLERKQWLIDHEKQYNIPAIP